MQVEGSKKLHQEVVFEEKFDGPMNENLAKEVWLDEALMDVLWLLQQGVISKENYDGPLKGNLARDVQPDEALMDMF